MLTIAISFFKSGQLDTFLFGLCSSIYKIFVKYIHKIKRKYNFCKPPMIQPSDLRDYNYFWTLGFSQLRRFKDPESSWYTSVLSSYKVFVECIRRVKRKSNYSATSFPRVPWVILRKLGSIFFTMLSRFLLGPSLGPATPPRFYSATLPRF